MTSVPSAISTRRNTPHTTHLQDPSASAKIIRERHPFEGRTLSVLSSSRRRGVWHLLVILPDGSRSLVPAAWTDWRVPTDTTRVGSTDATISLHNLGTLSDLLQARTVLDALLRRLAESATQKESCHATATGTSRPAATCDSRPTPLGPARRGGARGGARNSRTPHRPHARGKAAAGDKE